VRILILTAAALAATAVMVVLTGAPADAHHASAPFYDNTKSVEAEGVENPQIDIGGLPHGNVRACGDARHVEKIPIRGRDVEGVNRFEVHCVDDLAGVLEVRGDEDASCFLKATIFVEIGFGTGIFEDHVESVEAAG